MTIRSRLTSFGQNSIYYGHWKKEEKKNSGNVVQEETINRVNVLPGNITIVSKLVSNSL